MLVAHQVPWFPQEYAEAFYYAKAILGLIATLLLLLHMHMTWGWLMRCSNTAQRARYMVLLGFSVVVTGGSLEQLDEGDPVNYRNVAVLLVTVSLIVAMVISLRQDGDRRTLERHDEDGGTMSD